MALEKTSTVDKIEVVGQYKIVQIREVIKITEDGNLISKSFHRKTIHPGQDYSGESLEVRRICAVVHTAEVLTLYNNRDLNE